MQKQFLNSSYSGYKLLPLLQYVEQLFPKSHLENVYLLSCQHILPSTHMMIRSMINLGLKLDRIALIGKCYSTNKTTMQNMINDGIYVCKSSSEFKKDVSFDEQFRKNVEVFLQKQLERMKPDKNAHIIILDDGGELLTMAQELSKFYTNIYGVEQTSSGYHKLAHTPMNFPVKNVALSKEKLNFESPFIASSIMQSLEDRISLSKMSPKEILVIGNGFIGKEILSLLKEKPYTHHNVSKYDIVKTKSDIDYLDFSKFDIILGATGNKIMTHNYYDVLKNNAVLASVSSSDREFDGHHFRRLSSANCNVHDDIFYKNICLLNCGFPLNFNGADKVSLPLSKIQLVCALLLAGVCEFKFCNKQQSNFVQLDKELTEKILSQFKLMEETQ